MPTSTMCGSCGENQQLHSDLGTPNLFVPHVNPRTGTICDGMPNPLVNASGDSVESVELIRQHLAIVQRQQNRIMQLVAQRDDVLTLLAAVEVALRTELPPNYDPANPAHNHLILPTYEELISDIREILTGQATGGFTVTPQMQTIMKEIEPQ